MEEPPRIEDSAASAAPLGRTDVLSGATTKPIAIPRSRGGSHAAYAAPGLREEAKNPATRLPRTASRHPTGLVTPPSAAARATIRRGDFSGSTTRRDGCREDQFSRAFRVVDT